MTGDKVRVFKTPERDVRAGLVSSIRRRLELFPLVIQWPRRQQLSMIRYRKNIQLPDLMRILVCLRYRAFAVREVRVGVKKTEICIVCLVWYSGGGAENSLRLLCRNPRSVGIRF